MVFVARAGRAIGKRKPRIHISPPRGWLNDPCAPWQDDKGVYHIYFQWVPDSTEWTRTIGWGHAWSSTLLEWDYDNVPILMPGPAGSPDSLGVFTGGMIPTSTTDKVVIYTAINDLAHKNYTQGQEGLLLARSTDGGMTFVKDTSAVPLRSSPDLTVSGWRDPFVSTWPSLSSHLNTPPDQLFATISGGLVGKGPTLFLYSLSTCSDNGNSEDWNWQERGMLFEPAFTKIDSVWKGDRGYNYECANFFDLSSSASSSSSSDSPLNGSNGDGTNAQEKETFTPFVLISAETLKPRSNEPKHPNAPPKPNQCQLWFSGSFSSSQTSNGNGEVGTCKMEVKTEGMLDWGCLYAAQSFLDTTGRRLMTGWLPDHDLLPSGREEQGYAGTISLPRELFVQTTTNVSRALVTPLNELPSFEVLPFHSDGPEDLYEVRTLGIKPAMEVYKGRGEAFDLLAEGGGHCETTLKMGRTQVWEAELIFNIEDGCDAPLGLKLDFEEGEASISFNPSTEEIVVERSNSNQNPTINSSREKGKHTLFHLSPPHSTPSIEPLHLRVFFDTTILEIFANDRFALSTHVYAGDCSVSLLSGMLGLKGVTVEKALVWRY